MSTSTSGGGGAALDPVHAARACSTSRAASSCCRSSSTGSIRVPERLTIDYRVLFDQVPGHRGFLLVEHNWATGTFANEGRISLIFSPGSTRQEFDIASGGRLRGFLAVVWLGTDHIWMGFDHVMFLVALLLPAVLVRRGGRWREGANFMPALINVVKIVTAFTVAHSVTLTLASLGLVHLPGRLVEVVIAAIDRDRRRRSGVSGVPWADLAGGVRVRAVPRIRFRRRARGDGTAARDISGSRSSASTSVSNWASSPSSSCSSPMLFALRRLAAYRQLAPPGRGRRDDRGLGRDGSSNVPSTSSCRGPERRLDWSAVHFHERPTAAQPTGARGGDAPPAAPAVRCDGETLSYEELARRANGLARVLVATGLDRGDRVAVWLAKGTSVPVGFHGTFAAGGTLVPIDPKSPLEQVVRIIRSTGATHLVTEPERRDSVCAARSRRAPSVTHVIGLDPGRCGAGAVRAMERWSSRSRRSASGVPVIELDPAYILHTSGSTGQPKLILHTHYSAMSFVEWAVVGVRADQRRPPDQPLVASHLLRDLRLLRRRACGRRRPSS